MHSPRTDHWLDRLSPHLFPFLPELALLIAGIGLLVVGVVYALRHFVPHLAP